MPHLTKNLAWKVKGQYTDMTLLWTKAAIWWEEIFQKEVSVRYKN